VPRSRTSAAELLVSLRRDDATPLHGQLEQELRAAVRDGRLRAGAPMPSTRALAAQLGLSRGVVVEAYEQLAAEGYLTTQPGAATRVAREAAPPVATSLPAASSVAQLVVDFRPGRPDLSQFPRASWLRSLRRVLNEAPSERFSYSDGRGLAELREALAAYLNRVRGTCASPDLVVITNGFTQGLGIVANVLHSAGARRVAVEDPSFYGSRDTLLGAGLEVIGVPVDDNGLRVDTLEETGADAVLVTPAHQYPTGAVLPPKRRAALVEWAGRHGALIVEDDYDAEYRYDREPIGAIHGLAPDRVIYAGSASKTLAPGLRLGWLLVPSRLAGPTADAKLAADHGSPALEQLAFADFVTRGELDRHLRRMRPIYRGRRDALLAALARHLPQFRPTGTAAGLHLLAWLPTALDETAVVARAERHSVGVYGLGPQRMSRGGPGGLIFGYGTLSEPMLTEGVRLLAEALGDA
jgi:GntR family transcriptional regulator/MocR family aminotransferase